MNQQIHHNYSIEIDGQRHELGEVIGYCEVPDAMPPEEVTFTQLACIMAISAIVFMGLLWVAVMLA